MFFLKLAVIAVASYLIGSISFSIIASKFFGKGDLREKGSGNAGLTNALRTGGKRVAILTLVGDSCKGVLSVLISRWILCSDATPNALEWGMYVAALCVILGHIFPLYFKFQGGKGVLTAASTLAVLDWRIFLVVIGVFIIVFLITGIVSVSSLASAVLLPGTTLLFGFNNFPYSLVFAMLIAFIIIIGHRTNITRIINGTEKKLFHKKGEE